jgi:hypothetical protein
MLIFLFLLAAALPAAEPIRLHPDNPHYFEFRGKPTVLITSAEHYGGVLNGAFDYVKYLDTLAKDNLNMTRIFTGIYREVPTDFGILRNTLAPEDANYVSPYASAGNGKFDLQKWNPKYIERLRNFITEAGKRGIVVEVTLFCTYYQDHMWKLSPWHEQNNINNIGKGITNTQVLTLKDPALTDVQSALVRKIVAELKDFDNVYFELVNEPYFAGVTLQFQEHMSKVIAETGTRQMIAQNIANNHQLITKPNPLISLFNFHYARPPLAVGENYHLNKAIGLDETGFDGTLDFVYRIQAWDFLMAGGAHYNNLDYSFAVGHEDGSFRVPGDQPGGGSAALRSQLKTLHEFMRQFDFIRMKPDATVATAPARVLSEPGKQYAIYVHHAEVRGGERPRVTVRTTRQQTTLGLQLPPGNYTATWWDPKNGRKVQSETFQHTGSTKSLQSPNYTEDIALAVISKP